METRAKDKNQRELREPVRCRKSLVGKRSRELNRLQKMLEGANIKISGTITDINGKSARNILEHYLEGIVSKYIYKGIMACHFFTSQIFIFRL